MQSRKIEAKTICACVIEVLTQFEAKTICACVIEALTQFVDARVGKCVCTEAEIRYSFGADDAAYGDELILTRQKHGEREERKNNCVFLCACVCV